MIIGGDRTPVIDNIRRAIMEGELNKKVEVSDPKLTDEEKLKISRAALDEMEKRSYRLKSKTASRIMGTFSGIYNRKMRIVGLENLKGVDGGAMLTSLHFNQFDSTVIRKLAKRCGKKRLYIIVQETNLAMSGFLGFMMKYSDTIPITMSTNYMERKFFPKIKSLLDDNEWILIYPEQEMWFNYRKPRTLKRGAYYYAAKCNVPIIPCFVEMQNGEKKDNDEFYKVEYTLHVLPPIYPESGKSVSENSRTMMEKDYAAKKAAYEQAYHKPLTYDFSEDDIAGWIH